MVTKLQNSKCDYSHCDRTWTQFMTNSKTQIMSNSNCDEAQIVMKLLNSNCDETQKLKWWQNSKT